MEERRNYKRVYFKNNIRCNILDNGFVTDTISHSINISGGGIGLNPDTRLSRQQPISLEIMVPGYYKSIFARGEVMWSDPQKVAHTTKAGIKFTKIDSYDRQMILDYVHFGFNNEN